MMYLRARAIPLSCLRLNLHEAELNGNWVSSFCHHQAQLAVRSNYVITEVFVLKLNKALSFVLAILIFPALGDATNIAIL